MKKVKMPSTSTMNDKAKTDIAIMGTNSSSIVSKRSVERIYDAETDPKYQFLRYFVKKPQRRSPLINRGYWLRMKAVHYFIQRFLDERTTTRKIVVNLGCGFDPLPFERLSRDGEDNDNSPLYIDIDYPDLIKQKCHAVHETPELNGLLKNVVYSIEGSIKLRSNSYIAVGLDLLDIAGLNSLFMSQGWLDCSILFTSEVAITYMDREGADRLIAWAGTLPDARVSVLEQMLPSGSTHPFAKTMLAHFENLSTELKSISTYPTLQSQIERYAERGWRDVNGYDLLEVWNKFIPMEEKKFVESVEAFDEVEEFTHFAQHYFILYASQNDHLLKEQSQGTPLTSLKPNGVISINEESSLAAIDLDVNYVQNKLLQRRFCAAAVLSDQSIIVHGGLNNSSRLGTSLHISGTSSTHTFVTSESEPPARMCHTLTALSNDTALLLGGRTSPDTSLQDCWLLDSSNHWKKVAQNLPEGRYRHCATTIHQNQVLVFGGKTKRDLLIDKWLLWSKDNGWQSLESKCSQCPCARYSAAMATISIDPSEGYSTGILSGGIDKNGNTLNDFWIWTVKKDDQIIFQNLPTSTQVVQYIGRYGHQMVSRGDGKAYMIGGVCDGKSKPYDYRILEYDGARESQFRFINVQYDLAKLPLLVGFSACMLKDGTILIIGGGGVCFSMGSYWNNGMWTLNPATSELNHEWTVSEVKMEAKASNMDTKNSITINGKTPSAGAVPVLSVNKNYNFESEIRSEQPFILTDVDFGPCVKLWTPEYLKERVGLDRQVVVHDSNSSAMNFQTKNFSYRTIPFNTLIDTAFSIPDINPTSPSTTPTKMYLRSLSSTSPTKLPADFTTDFPTIASDFQLPPSLSYITDRTFSSPLRISSPNIALWLHYDVHSNILVSVRGHKRLLLFPPSDILHLSFPAGSTTSTIDDIFNNIPANTHPMIYEMKPGDALYIPPLWLHAAWPLTACVSVNVFFKGWKDEVYSNEGRDVYGNKDLKAYEKGRVMVGRMVKEFEGLEGQARRFYLERLGKEILEAARRE